MTGRRVDAGDRAGDEDLGPEPVRLLERPLRELVPGDARREAEIVLDPRGRAGLSAGRLALDHDRLEALGRSVHGRGQPRGAGADDHGVVLRCVRLGLDLEHLGHPAQLRAHHRLPVDDPESGVVALGRQVTPPLRGLLRDVRLRAIGT